MSNSEYHGICCVCGHRLDEHVDEGDAWRCHSLGPDAYQCECALRQVKAGDEGLGYYDLGKRIDEQAEFYSKGFRLSGARS